MATRFQICSQALRDLERAVLELDQIHASLKDVGLDNVSIHRVRHFAEHRNIFSLVNDAEALLKELRIAQCPECSHRICDHDDPQGCSVSVTTYARCGCRWALEKPGARHSLREYNSTN